MTPAPSPGHFTALAFRLPQATRLLSVVIVNYNLGDMVECCVASLMATSLRDELEIIVVDNASAPGDLDGLRSRFQDVVVLALPANIGFGGANNIGFEQASGHYILALNPDTLVPSGLLERSLELLRRDPRVGVVGAPQKVASELYVSSAQEDLRPAVFLRRILPLLAPRRAISQGPVIGGNLARDVRCAAVTGCYMMFERSVLERAGGFDRRIFMYGEEVELCWRIRQLGYDIVQLGSTYVDHDHGASTKGLSVWRDVQMQSGQLLCVRLTHGVGAARWSAAAMTAAHLLRLPLEVVVAVGGRSDKLASRLARLRRSARAILTPPERSDQAI